MNNRDIVPQDFDVDYNNGDSSEVFPIGQYKGESISSCEDIRYMRWLLEQEWFQDKYPLAYQAVEEQL